ncbi:hypothetical protein D9619_000723 [Psilocybe cf. subviscida]|uniref:Autophagy-related protein 29 n=1 Tax=Psilocybe cf. subviscida TaxID=2480587 RepID=A0A8H5BEC0_9AGAR|nr:hypothetical protein D9619_000723 [Psilocybe cf. subviscida]
MPATTPLNVRVVVKLPYNRPEDALSNPTKIVWNQEKADILWKVIERSRSADSAGADWKGLAEHLEVPLPYLLYRVNARFQEDIRGLRDIKGALSPTSAQEPSLSPGPSGLSNPPLSATNRLGGSARATTTPMSVRQRLNSLGNHALASARRKPVAGSNATFQAAQATATTSYHAPTSPPLSDEEEDSDDEDAIKEEEAERQAEEEETLARKLVELQRMMTTETIGLVSAPRAREKGKVQDRGRMTPVSPHSLSSSRMDTLSSRSQSISSVGSPQGSIPDIPSQSSGSQPHSPVGRDFPRKASSPPAVSARNKVKRQFGVLPHPASDLSSNQGSSASSFSDLSDASLSASALESAFGSNLGGSRLSQFTRSRPTSNRTHSVVPQ